MNYKKFLMLSLTVFMLSACGGGGGGHHSAVTPIPDPTPDTPTDPVDKDTPNPIGKPIVIAHRGASGYLPEHTLGGYELAIKMNADYIEPDLQFTSDGVLVAMHDDSLDRTTNVAEVFPGLRNGHTTYLVSDFTLAEIKQLTVVPKGTASTSYPGFTPSMADPFKIPTFDEVLAFAKAQSEKVGRQIGVYPEAKQADPAMEDGILAALAAHGMNKPDSLVYIQSFSNDTILSLHEKQRTQGTKVPLIVLGAAVLEGSTAKMGVYNSDFTGMVNLNLSEVAKYASGLGVYLNAQVTREFIEQAHAAGLKVHGWTFNKAGAAEAQKEYRKYLDMGMDGMFSNYPNLAVLARDQFNVPNDKISSGPLVIAHRGTTGYLPEHTLGGYELAIKMRVDYIEPDVQLTSDNQLIAMHDANLSNTTNIADLFVPRGTASSGYDVSQFTLAEIKTLTVRPRTTTTTASDSYPGFAPSMTDPFKVPTLDEVITFAKQQSTKYGRPIGIYPEVKQPIAALEDGVFAGAETLRGNANVPVIIQSFYAESIQRLHQKKLQSGSTVPLAMLGYPVMENGVAKLRLSGTQVLNGVTYNSTNFIDLATVAGMAQGLGVSITSTTPANLPAEEYKKFIDQAHALGLKVHGWTFNYNDAIDAAKQYQQFLEIGMDGIFSNFGNLAVMARDQFVQQP